MSEIKLSDTPARAPRRLRRFPEFTAKLEFAGHSVEFHVADLPRGSGVAACWNCNGLQVDAGDYTFHIITHEIVRENSADQRRASLRRIAIELADRIADKLDERDKVYEWKRHD